MNKWEIELNVANSHTRTQIRILIDRLTIDP